MDNTDPAHARDAWRAAGYVCLPAAGDGTKRPAVPWKDYQGRVPTDAEYTAMPTTDGIGLLCGAVSGHLEMLEVEGRAEAEGILPAIAEAMDNHGLLDLWQRITGGYSERTPNGGIHWLLRTDGPARPNTKIARRPGPNGPDVLIETRGEGGWVVIAPSNGTTHPTGNPWKLLWGGPDTVPTITVEQRDTLYAILNTLFDEMPAFDTPAAGPAIPAQQHTDVGERPGDHYNAQATWHEILEPAGWRTVHRMGTGWAWVRPGKNPRDGISATTGQSKDGVDRLYVFTTSTEFPTEEPISKFRAYTILHHGGDYAGASAALRQAGYGGVRTSNDTAELFDMVDPSVWQGGRQAAEQRIHDAVEAAAVDVADQPWWDERDYLRHIRTAARATRTSPMAVLGIVLTRTAAEIGTHVVLPPLSGGYGSLNLFCGIVGRSSAGKGASLAAAAGLRDWQHDEEHVGSGEAILHMYVEAVRDDGQWQLRQHTERALIVIDEIDTLTGLAGRTGNTLLSTLRSAWSGGSIGFGYADRTKRLKMKAHSYRLGLVAGIQPERAGALFGDAGGGTPQRFVWVSAHDPSAPEVVPEHPGLMPWRVPKSTTGLWTHMPASQVVLDVAGEVRAEVDRDRLIGLRGEADVNNHRTYSRLKIAAVLGLLDGRTLVSCDDWQLAGHIMDASDRVASGVEAVLAAEASKVTQAKARAQKEIALEVAEATHTQQVARAARGIGQGVWAAGEQQWSVARKRQSSRVRRLFDEAVDVAVRAGWITVSEVPHGHKDESVRVLRTGEVRP